MSNAIRTSKKLIEVSLPIPEINDASAYDKMPGIGPHPKGIHQWWARLPLPTARAVLFASVVDDPSAHPEQFLTEESQSAERERLFDIVRRMMGKKLHEHPDVYAAARKEMLKYCNGNLPVVFDPFSGGGSIPLEANRLGFATHAGDLNPVAVLLNKCNLEIAPQWVGQPPVNPDSRQRIGGVDVAIGTGGLAADIRYYSKLIRQRAAAKIGDLYPRVSLPDEYGGGKADVIAWLWARTVRTPNPAFPHSNVPLASSFVLSTKPGKQAYIAPIVSGQDYSFTVSLTESTHSKAGTKLARGSFRCILSDVPIRYEYIDDEANAGRMGTRLMAVVANGPRGRVYLPPKESMEAVAHAAKPDWIPDAPCRGTWASNAQGRVYGFHRFADYFTVRQLAALSTFSCLVREVSEDIRRDAIAADLSNDKADEYSTAVVTFLALALDRCADFNNSLCRWSPSNEKVMNLFGRQAIPMVWDFAEANISADSVGGWSTCSDYVADCVEVLGAGSATRGCAHQLDAAVLTKQISEGLLVSTDPPYYDNISYASLSDFFYVWLRHTLGNLYPDLFSTVLVPKAPELTASAERFEGDKDEAKKHFEMGFRKTFVNLRDRMDRRFPLTVYYAFKQDDEGAPEEVSKLEPKVDLTTGWETLLEALVGSGFQITGTWPVRASQKWRMVSMGTNSLASYIVLACRPRPADAPQTDRRSFVAELKQTLPSALRRLQQANIAPVDFAQAAIGPGMAIFSKYTRIFESTGKTMAVRAALSLINQSLTEVLSELEDDFDGDTRWAIAWFEQQGFSDGDFGQAELLSKAKVTSVAGLQHSGIISSHAGKVRLIRPRDLPKNWNPATTRNPTVWEMTHHLMRVYYYEEGGDAAAAALLNRIGARGEIARELAYRLFDICEKKKRSLEAQGYNALVLGWPEIARLARESRSALPVPKQTELYGQE